MTLGPLVPIFFIPLLMRRRMVMNHKHIGFIIIGSAKEKKHVRDLRSLLNAITIHPPHSGLEHDDIKVRKATTTCGHADSSLWWAIATAAASDCYPSFSLSLQSFCGGCELATLWNVNGPLHNQHVL